MNSTHPALFAVGQHLVLLLGVEDDRFWGEGEGLALEGGALVRADEHHLITLIYRAHQNDLKHTE